MLSRMHQNTAHPALLRLEATGCCDAERPVRSRAHLPLLTALLLAPGLLLVGGATGCTPPEPPPALTTPGVGLEVDPLIRARIDRTLIEVANEAGDVQKRSSLAFVYDANGLEELAAREYELLQALAPRDPLWPYRVAIGQLDRGLYAEAKTALEALIETHPSFGPALHRLAILRLSDGDIAGARALVDRCLALLPNALPAKVTLADIHLREGKADLALPILETVTRSAPDDLHARFLLGRAMQETGGNAAVAEVLRSEGAGATARVIEDPREQEISRNHTGLSIEMDRAIALLQTGRAADAVRVLRAVRAAHPDDASVAMNLAQALNQNGDEPGALAMIGTAADLEPQNFRVHLVRAMLELGAGDKAALGTPPPTGPGGVPLDPTARNVVTEEDRARARAHYETALAAGARAARLGNQEPRTHFVYARAAHRAGQLDTARRSLEQARELAPEDLEVLQFLFEVAFQLDDRRTARAALETIVTRDPGHLVSWVNLVHLRRLDGDLDSAQEALAKAIALDGQHPRVLDAKQKLDAARASEGGSSTP